VIKTGDAAAAQEQLKAVARNLDKVSATSTMHKNTAARKKSRLAKRINALKAKTA
jgi:small subunit ribosomal protein S20